METDSLTRLYTLPLLPLLPDSRPGLYVHLPFCLTRCSYCDFFSVTGDFFSATGADSDIMAGLVDGIIAEARLYAAHPAWQGQAFGSLYLGGGTPSLLPPSLLARLVTGLGAELAIAPDAGTTLEITVEANPDDVTADWLALLCDLGVTRLSLGVQSFDDAELRWLGRRHDAACARQAIDLAQGAGPPALSIDLMFGLPGQTPAQWRHTLEQALAYEPAHLSCYQLTIEANTPLGRQGVAAAPEEL